MDKTYSIGIDFGTLSARAILIDNRTGEEIISSVYGYQDAVLDQYLNSPRVKLPPDYALQNPQDYRDAVTALLKDIRQNSNVAAKSIVSIGLDFTACTVVAVDEKGKPLCQDSRFAANPHAWVKLWKHHGAQEEADRINQVALERNERFLKYYGNIQRMDVCQDTGDLPKGSGGIPGSLSVHGGRRLGSMASHGGGNHQHLHGGL